MRLSVLTDRNMRLLVLGQLISAIGDQFYLLAMPWLGLQLTGKALIAGTLLAVASVPRALFMLAGGAATDRHSARSLLLASNSIQAALMTVLGLLLLVPYAQLWSLYLLAFFTGVADAFGVPALNSILPRLLEKGELEEGNIYLQGVNMLSLVIGPALAGLLISLASSNGAAHSSVRGIGVAFLVDGLTFLVGVLFFWRIRTGSERAPAEGPEQPLLASIPALIQFVRGEVQLRNLFLLALLLGLLLTGTVRIGFALLADVHLPGGVRDLGGMSSALGAGVLVGMVSVRALPKPPGRISGLVTLAVFAVVPLGLVLLGLLPPIGYVMGIVIAMGLSLGYVMITLLSWLQRRTPEAFLGRIMAAFFFATLGLSPLSQLLMGFLLDLNLQWTMIAVGGLVLALLALMGSDRRMWSLEERSVSPRWARERSGR